LEALIFKPSGNGPFATLIMIHGYGTDCFMFKESGKLYTRDNFIVFAPSMLGFGKSKGSSDFGGPKTIKMLLNGIEYLKSQDFVDKSKIVIYGFSRGAHAASILITKTRDIQGAVLIGGTYDLEKHYDYISTRELKTKKLIEDESGINKVDFSKRSVIKYIDQIECPILIIHGERDVRTSPEQARLFADALSSKQKPFELFIVPDADHALTGVTGIRTRLIKFYKNILK
jgi:dipeptidyl aminopeptidase/acylaminoacyl peptidase